MINDDVHNVHNLIEELYTLWRDFLEINDPWGSQNVKDVIWNQPLSEIKCYKKCI